MKAVKLLPKTAQICHTTFSKLFIAILTSYVIDCWVLNFKSQPIIWSNFTLFATSSNERLLFHVFMYNSCHILNVCMCVIIWFIVLSLFGCRIIHFPFSFHRMIFSFSANGLFIISVNSEFVPFRICCCCCWT